MYFYNKITSSSVGRKNEFKNYSSIIDSLGVPYDLKSVMHYGPKVWSKNGKDTIVPKNKDVSFVLSSRGGGAGKRK